MPKKRQARRKLWKVQRAIVLQLLRDDHDRLWTREELRDEIPDISRHMFDLSIELLEDDACIALEADGLCASTSVRHLDELDLIGI
jgi:hypothetical protein